MGACTRGRDDNFVAQNDALVARQMSLMNIHMRRDGRRHSSIQITISILYSIIKGAVFHVQRRWETVLPTCMNIHGQFVDGIFKTSCIVPVDFEICTDRIRVNFQGIAINVYALFAFGFYSK